MKRMDLKRGKALLALLMTIFAGLAVRLYFLNVHPTERVEANYKNHQTESISDSKYMLLDTSGKDLVEYEKKYVLVIDSKPFSLNNYGETLEDLMALNFIMKGENSDFNYTDVMKSQGKLYYTISEETYNKINKLDNLKGVYTFISDKVDTKEAWSVNGMISNITDKNIVQGSIEEEIYNNIKNNEIPKKNFYLDEKNVYADDELVINDNNRNIKLTIDKEFDSKIRDVLSKEEYQKYKNVGVSIMESDTGKIKALVQKNESEANINLGIEGMGYEPGSIYKLITYGAALEEGLITPYNTVACNGKMCNGKVHGTLTVNQGLIKSCNDVFGAIGRKVGYDKLMEYSEKLGLFKKVIGIQGEGRNETSGVKPKNDDPKNNNIMALIPIGQSMNVSPIQMLGAVNTFTNNGVYVKPYILESILDNNDKVVKQYETQKERIFTETTSKIVKNGMKEVVTTGTGKSAFVQGNDMGGKTGSSSSSNNTTHGWFAGYFTINNKQYTMIVFVPDLIEKEDENIGGGNTAAPIFKDIVLQLNKK